MWPLDEKGHQDPFQKVFQDPFQKGHQDPFQKGHQDPFQKGVRLAVCDLETRSLT